MTIGSAPDMPGFPEPPAPLADDRAALRPAAERDIPEVLIAHQDDPGLARALWLDRPPSGAELGRRVEASPGERTAGRDLWLTIVPAGGDDGCRGQLEVRDVDADHRRAELTLWVAPAARGRGLGTSALRLAGEWLLRDTFLARVGLLADPGDPAIRAAAARAGFRSEGVLRGYRLLRSGRVDVEAFSLVEADLEAATRR
jgi:RimJ/RimL family protein N-acetyltransferase